MTDPVRTTPENDDPLLWLEDVQGAAALDWVRGQNQLTQSELMARPEYGPTRAQLLEVLNARDRIPFADVYSMLGSICYQKGRLLDALALFDEALRLNPGYTEAALNLALTYNDLGKYDESKRVYQRMIASRKDSGGDTVDPFV